MQAIEKRIPDAAATTERSGQKEEELQKKIEEKQKKIEELQEQNEKQVWPTYRNFTFFAKKNMRVKW